MADWNLHLTLVSAANLVDVRSLGIMRVYAKVSINEVQELTYTSPVDYEGQTSPVWNFEAPYSFTKAGIQSDELKVVIKLYCERTFQEDKYVGEVNIPLKTLFHARYLTGGSGEFQVQRIYEYGCFGALKLSYRFVTPVPEEKSRVPSSVAREDQTSFTSDDLQEAASLVLPVIAKGLVEFFIPGASTIFDFM